MDTRQIQQQMSKAQKVQKVQNKKITDQEIAHQNSLIDENHAEIVKIGEDVKVINNIFENMATLVDNQSGYVDNIANNITHALNDLKDGNEDLKSAEKWQDMFSCPMM